LKREVAEVVIETVRPIREHYRRLMNDTSHLRQALFQCVDRVRPIADATLDRARRALGLSCTMSGTGAKPGGGQERWRRTW
jgi:tryptophanyl-tRNA synthetase